MKKYYVNTIPQRTGEHEVHSEDCQFLPSPENRIYLGNFASCHSAILEAKKYFNQVDGCYHCSRECHKR